MLRTKIQQRKTSAWIMIISPPCSIPSIGQAGTSQAQIQIRKSETITWTTYPKHLGGVLGAHVAMCVRRMFCLS